MLRIFYQKRVTFNRKYLRFTSPTILISNHPNTMVDPLTIASLPKKQVFFLGNAGLFGNAFTHWFFSTFYVIPIMRPGDKSFKKVNNADSFKQCYTHFEKGGSIYIAPEGGSFMGRQIRAFKTGTARIALGAEKANDFQLNLQILPIGLTYDYPSKFGSQQIINIGKPVQIKDYQDQYKSDPVETFKIITAELEQKIKNLTLHYSSEEENQFNYQYATFLRTEGMSESDIFKTLKAKQELPAAEKKSLYHSINQYFEVLDQYKITDFALFQNNTKNHSFFYFLGLIIGFPLFLFGAINNGIIYFLSYFASNKVKIDAGYLSTIKILTGLVSLPILYTIQYQLVKYQFGNPIALYYLLCLLPLGIFAWKYTRFAKRASYFFKTQRIAQTEKDKLWQNRKRINIISKP